MGIERRVQKKKPNLGILLLVVVALFSVFSIFSFYDSIKEEKVNISDGRLVDLATSNCRSAQIFFEGQQALLKGLAMSLEQFEDMTAPEVLNFLDDAAAKLNFDRLAIDTFDGYSYTSDGYIFDATGSTTLQRIQQGESFITDVKHTLTDGAQVVEILVPVCDPTTGAPIASLHCSIRCDGLAQRIGVGFGKQESYFHLVDGTGQYVTDGGSPNAILMNVGFFDAMKTMTYDGLFSYEKFMDDFENNRSNFIKYHFASDYRYAYYMPVGINHWYMIAAVPREVVDQSIKHALTTSSTLVINMLLAIAILFGYLLMGQLQANQRSELDEKCFRVLSEQTENIIFEWNFDTGKISSTSNFEKIFGREPVTSVSEEEAILLHAVHRDDVDSFTQVFKNIRDGYNVKDVRFRVRDAQREFVWCTISGVVIYDKKRCPYKAIGTLKNIDDAEKAAQLLRDRAEKDLLTDLYNKISTQLLVTEYLEEHLDTDVCGALLMIDLDCFKQVNDSMGHQFGDQVLVETAEQLKGIFRTTDIVGRVGGDEFIVFMKDVVSDEAVRERAAAVCASFSRLPVCQDCHYVLTGSVGVALFPQHGDSFSELYRLADLALYSAKNSGKNRYVVYQNVIQ